MNHDAWWVLCRTVERFGFVPGPELEGARAELLAAHYVESRAGTLRPTSKGLWYYATRWTMFYRRHAFAQGELFR